MGCVADERAYHVTPACLTALTSDPTPGMLGEMKATAEVTCVYSSRSNLRTLCVRVCACVCVEGVRGGGCVCVGGGWGGSRPPAGGSSGWEA